MNYILKISKEREKILEDFLSNMPFKTIEEMKDRNEVINSESHPELFNWIDVIFNYEYNKNNQKMFKKHDNPNYENSDDWACNVTISYNGNTYTFYIFLGHGSIITVVKNNAISHDIGTIYTVEEVIECANYRLAEYKKRIKTIEEKIQYKEELNTKLNLINATRTLFEVFGLKLTKESEKKVKQWEREYENVI